MRHVSVLVTLVVASLLLAVPVAGAAAPPTGVLSQQRSLGLSGVSPFAERQADGSVRLYYAADGGTAIDACTVAGTCTRVGVIPFRMDVSVVRLADGSRRAYFKELDPTTQLQVIGSATIEADGITLGPTVRTDITAPMEKKAWGVPDAVVLPNGRVRIYWTDSASGTAEFTRSATSTDASGTVFTADPGRRTTGGLVDFEVLRAVTGSWLAVASTTPGRPPQRLLVGRSRDGLRWTFGTKSVSSPKRNALDPAGFALGRRNTFRLYFTTSPKANPFAGFTIEQATLTIR